MNRAADVERYIEAAPAAAQPTLLLLRRIIRAAVPEAAETISYGMPFYAYAGQRLVYFSAAKRHVGVYGLVHVDREVPPDLAPFVDHRSTLRFRFDEPLPAPALDAALRLKAQALAAGAGPISEA